MRVMTLVAGHTLLTVLANLPFGEGVKMAIATETGRDVRRHIGVGMACWNRRMTREAADAAFGEFSGFGVKAGAVAIQALLWASLLDPGFLEDGVGHGVAVGALFPIAAQTLMTTNALGVIGHGGGILTQRLSAGDGDGRERQDHKQRAEQRAEDDPFVL